MENSHCNPDKWGKYFWKYLHILTLGYPDNPSQEIKDIFRNEIETLKYKLPCIICQKHFITNYNEFPLNNSDLENKEKLSRWMIKFHNKINKMLGKKERDEDVMILYYELLSGCELSNNSINLKKKILDKIKKKYNVDEKYKQVLNNKYDINDIIIKLIY